MMKSLTEWIRNSETGSEDIYQSVLRLTRACSMIDDEENDESRGSWISFVEFAVSNLVFGDYYNLGKFLSDLNLPILEETRKINASICSISGMGLIDIDLCNQ